jgi:hypothetical protein
MDVTAFQELAACGLAWEHGKPQVVGAVSEQESVVPADLAAEL